MNDMVSFVVEKNFSDLNSKIILSLVIPTYNESGNITKLILSLMSILDPILPHAYEIIVVDDNSSDSTSKEVNHLTKEYKQVRLLVRKHEKGLSSAVIRGWQLAKGKFLGVMDGDLQHPPEIIPRLLDKIIDQNHIDIVIASRFVSDGSTGDWSVRRRVISSWGRLIGLILLPGIIGKLSDPMSGCFVVRRNIIIGHVFRPLGYKILIEIIARANIINIKEISYVFQKREVGQSKISLKIILQYIEQLIQLRSST